MSGFFGSGSDTTTNTLDPAARAILDNIISETNSFKASNPGFVQPFDAAQVQGLQQLQDRPQSEFIGSAADNLNQTLSGGFFGQNPANQGFNAGLQGVRDSITDQATQAVGDQFSLAGRTGSPAQQTSLAKTITQNLAPFEFNAFGQNQQNQFQGFENERQRQNQGLQLAPQIEGIQDAQAQRLFGVGNAIQQQNQATLTEPQQSFEFFLNPLLAASGSLPVSSTQKNRASGSGVVSGIGGILGGLFCDIRIKENIEPFGTSDGIKIYTFNYIPEFGVGTDRRIGPMAQEVELNYPEAVFTVGGIKVIDMKILGEKL